MKFCSECGSSNVSYSIPTGDNRDRHHCSDCGNIDYRNPKIICGCLPIYGDKILLCKRAIEPRYGYWTLPAGYMEKGETTLQGAQRETREEAEAEVEIDDLYVIYNLPHISQVYFFYRGNVVDGKYGAGEESLEVELFSQDDIPWDSLAFPTVSRSLELYFGDRSSGQYPLRVEDIIREPRNAFFEP